MNKNSSKFASGPNVKVQKTREGSYDDAMDLEVNEDIPYSGHDERISKKMAARRKIDIYMEKKRLKEELEYNDLLDDELDF